MKRPAPALAMALPLAALAACTTGAEPPQSAAPPTPEPAACDREATAQFIGRTASAELGEEMLAATGATTLRWVPPRTAVTMDFRPDRLTVSYNDDMMIERVSCT